MSFSAGAAVGSVKTPLDRALSLFAEVRSGEAVTALLLAVNVFVLLSSYYLLKTIREPLILTQGGAEVKSYAAAGQALLLLFVVGAYGKFAERVNRIRLISYVTLFFISNLAVFYALGTAGLQIGVAFYLWVGIFNVFIVAQFWAFANDVYSEEQGKRLFPIVGVGSSLGAWAGAEAAKRLFGSLDPASGPYTMMLIAGAGLAACIGLSQLVQRRERVSGDRAQVRASEKPLGKEGGFALIFQQRYLTLIALIVLLLNVVNTLGGFVLDKVVLQGMSARISDAAELQAAVGAFYGDLFSWVNLLSFLFQLFLVSRIFKYVGVRGAMFILPCIALGGYALIITAPVLGLIRLVKILENSTDYSIQNTARHALFLPTSREAKYKAKAVIDSFVWRIGDMLQAGIVFAGVNWLAFGVAQFALVNVVFVAIWLGVVVGVFREHKRLTAAPEPAAEAVAAD